MKDKKIIFAIIILVVIILAGVIYFCFIKNEKNNVNVSFDSNGGSVIDNVHILEGNKIKLPAEPTREGYIFAYYELSDGRIASDEITVDKDEVLKVNWIKDDAEYVTVTYGTNKGEPIKVKYEKGSTLKWLELPLREEYELYGWTNDEGEIVPTTYVLTKDIYLMPRWLNKSNKKITITVNYDDGSQEFKYISLDGDVASLPVKPVRDGYTFKGWTLDDGTVVSDRTSFNGDTTIKALWNR